MMNAPVALYMLFFFLREPVKVRKGSIVFKLFLVIEVRDTVFF